jgi:hypothetical protein
MAKVGRPGVGAGDGGHCWASQQWHTTRVMGGLLAARRGAADFGKIGDRVGDAGEGSSLAYAAGCKIADG